MRNLGTLLSVAVAVALLAMLAFSTADTEPKLAPDFSLMSLDGEEIRLSQYAGNVVVIDFWATWCTPCLRSFPALHELVARVEDRGVVLLVISLDRSQQRARDYLVENGYSTAQVLWESRDASRAVKELYGVVGIPRTFVIDRNGYIQYSGKPSDLTDAELLRWL